MPEAGDPTHRKKNLHDRKRSPSCCVIYDRLLLFDKIGWFGFGKGDYMKLAWLLNMMALAGSVAVSGVAAQNSGSVNGDAKSLVIIKKTNNILQNTTQSSAMVRAGSIGNSNIQSVDVNIKSDNVTNLIKGSTHSSSTVDIGTVSHTKAGDVRIKVDARNIKSMVSGGQDNHAATHVGVLKNTRIGGRATIEVKANAISNSIAVGRHNQAEVSIGFDPDGEKTLPANAYTLNYSASRRPVKLINSRSVTNGGKYSKAIEKLKNALTSQTYTPMSLDEWSKANARSGRGGARPGKGSPLNAWMKRYNIIRKIGINALDMVKTFQHLPDKQVLAILKDSNQGLAVFAGYTPSVNLSKPLTHAQIQKEKDRLVKGVIRRARYYHDDLLPRQKNAMRGMEDARVRSIFGMRVKNSKYNPLKVKTVSSKMDKQAVLLLVTPFKMIKHPVVKLDKINSDLGMARYLSSKAYSTSVLIPAYFVNKNRDKLVEAAYDAGWISKQTRDKRKHDISKAGMRILKSLIN